MRIVQAVSAMVEGEAAKTSDERADELLRSGRLVFLQTVGYTQAEITKLGDLATVPSEVVSAFLLSKAYELMGKMPSGEIRLLHGGGGRD